MSRLLSLCLVPAALAVASCAPEPDLVANTPADPVAKPDILLVLTDDQGWGDWEGSGNPDILTPAMMELARTGASFTDFHVAPVCSPTRASLLTGRHSLETGVWGVTRGGERMRPEVETLAEALRDEGYRTGLFGKWHNGDSPPYDPASQGFERVFGFTTGHLTDYFDPVLLDDGEPVRTRGYITTTVTDRALDWIAEPTDQPSFTYVAYNTPHSPFEVEQRYLDMYEGSDLPDVTRVIYAMVTQLDEQFGRLLDAVDEDTVVIFMGDNGPARPGGVERYKDGLAGQKGSVLFGGTQVPMIIRWPGVTEPGSEIAAPAQGIDVLPTLLGGIGAEPAADVDGADLAAVFSGGSLPDRTLFTHHNNVLLEPGTIPVEVDPGAARRGRFSAVLDPDGIWALYDDRAQTRDVRDDYPEVFAELKREYLDWFAEVSPPAMEVLPTVIANAPVALPAHNGTPSDGAVFNGEWGWANDWIVVEDKGRISWPVRVEYPDRYAVEVSYAGEGTLTVEGRTFDLPAAQAPLSHPAPGHRRIVMTGEALTRDWASATVGPVDMEPGERDLMVELTGGLEIKSIRLTPK